MIPQNCQIYFHYFARNIFKGLTAKVLPIWQFPDRLHPPVKNSFHQNSTTQQYWTNPGIFSSRLI